MYFSQAGMRATVALWCVIVIGAGSWTTAVRAGDSPVAALVDSCESAKADFRQLTEADLLGANQELLSALHRLDARLAQAGENGNDWKKYLLWDAIQGELKKDKPNGDILKEAYGKYTASYEGLGLVWFLDVQRSLRRYLEVSAELQKPQIEKNLGAKLDVLASALKDYATKPTTENSLAISENLRWIKNAGQAAKLVDAVEKQFRQPNLLAEVSEKVVAAGIAESVDETAPVNECILKTSISGTGHTTGNVDVRLVPDQCRASLDTLLRTKTETDTVGYHKPVCIYTTGTTCISGQKRLWIDENGIFSSPACSYADTNTCINDIVSTNGRQFIEKLAWRRAEKQKPKAEAIAASIAEGKANVRMDEQAAESLEKANDAFVKKFRKPLEEHKLFPESLKFSTTCEALRVTALRLGTPLISAAAPAPEAVKGDIVLKVHESLINNFVLDAIGGMTVHEEKFQQAVKDTFGKLPDKMKGDEDEKPWAITFPRRQPISVSFTDNGFKVTIRGAEYYSGNDKHPAMNVTAAYKIEKTETGFKAVRQGDVEVFPPDFDPKGDQKLSARYTTIRTLLTKRFNKIFEPELKGEGLTLPGKWEKAGKFMPVQWVCQDGWLVLAWNKVAEVK